MHESWPACGGSTRVGTTRRLEIEKSRRRASGASNTISCGVVQAGGRRSEAVANQRGRSKAVGPRSTAVFQQSPAASIAAVQPSSQLSKSPEVSPIGATGGHCVTAFIFDLLAKLKEHRRGAHRCSQ